MYSCKIMSSKEYAGEGGWSVAFIDQLRESMLLRRSQLIIHNRWVVNEKRLRVDSVLIKFPSCHVIILRPDKKLVSISQTATDVIMLVDSRETPV